MMPNKFGLNWVLLIAVAFLLAACAGSTDGPQDSSSGAEQTDTDDGRPDDVDNTGVTEEDLGGDDNPFGNADQSSLAAYAGNDRVYFDYDSSDLNSASRRMLDKQIEWLKHHRGVRLVVEGHCDERGTREYNLALGERRAVSVRNYLTARGIPASRLRTISYGKERPAEVGNGESVWGQNRRGVLVVQ